MKQSGTAKTWKELISYLKSWTTTREGQKLFREPPVFSDRKRFTLKRRSFLRTSVRPPLLRQEESFLLLPER